MQEFELRADFAREVLDESERTPVLVDFWAPWCGPCRVLSPILEKLAREASGTWKLVTVNTDETPELAEALRIRSIPTVFLFSHGQPIATFSGALPEKDIREWLARHLPLVKEEGGTDEALRALREGRVADAKRLLKSAIEKDPGDGASRLLLARILFTEDVDKAADMVGAIPDDSEHHDAALHYRRLRDLVHWERGKAGARTVTGPEADIGLYREGVRDMTAGRFEAASEKWLSLVVRNRDLDEDGARKALVALLAVLGDDEPLTREYRRRLASALF